MATNKMRPIHPGEILREEFLATIGMSANALAVKLHVPAPRINDIVRERRAVTPDTALRLARYFDTTAQFWLNLQNSAFRQSKNLPRIAKPIVIFQGRRNGAASGSPMKMPCPGISTLFQ